MDLSEKLNALRTGEEVSEEVIETTEPVAESQQENVPATETAEQEVVQAQPDAATENETEVAAESEATEWAPSLKFKVLKEEHEFPEWTKDFVKSKEIEDQFVDLLTKANALEHQKKRRTELEDEFATLRTTHDSKMKDAVELAQIVKDFNSKIASNNPSEQLIALQSSGLSEKAILDMARHVLELQKMSPTQRSAYDQQFQQRDQINQYEQQLSQTQQTLQMAQQQAAQAQLTSFLSSKNDVISEYESRDGNNEGEFQQDFINFGVSLQSKLGREVEWKEAFKQFKKAHGLGKVKSKPAPKNLPNLKSSGHSPVERAFKSMDDLRNHINNKF